MNSFEGFDVNTNACHRVPLISSRCDTPIQVRKPFWMVICVVFRKRDFRGKWVRRRRGIFKRLDRSQPLLSNAHQMRAHHTHFSAYNLRQKHLQQASKVTIDQLVAPQLRLLKSKLCHGKQCTDFTGLRLVQVLQRLAQCLQHFLGAFAVHQTRNFTC